MSRDEVSECFGDLAGNEEKVLSECANLCSMFNLSAQDLFYKWEAINYNSSSRSITDPFTMDSVHALKSQIQRELASDNARKQQAKSKLPAAMSRGRGGFSGLMRPNLAKFEPTASGHPVKNLAGRTMTSHAVVAGPSKVTFQGPSGDSKKRAYRYMYEKISERSEALDDRIDEFSELVKVHYNLTDIGDPSASTEEEVVVVGRITIDSESASTGVKLNEASLSLESSRMGGSGVRVPLRFDPAVKVRGGVKGAGGLGLFPGAVAAFRGKNGGGGRFLVTEILVLPLLQPPSSAVKQDPSRSSFTMTIACGPFTPDSDLQYKPLQALFDKSKVKKPDVLLLIGPFIDQTHSKMKNGEVDYTPTHLFQTHVIERLREVLDASPGSIALLVPSVKDIVSSHAVFPQSELASDLANDPRIHMLPNPCRFSINDVSIATSSVDSLFHFRKEEFFKRAEEVDSIDSSASGDTGNDAMANLSRHIIQQRSFYPIFPVPADLSHEINLDVTHMEGLNLASEDDASAPDILVVPSRLKQFAKVIHSTTAINPSFLSKGTYAELEIGKASTPGQVKVEILKIDTASSA